ncbi:zinc-ribbon domain-containing protein [Sedimenticola hydrogenitrophicus]|uniref:zinc-ribbon domain-containing protein n=1 Tax=Sedimenticola hydrogenitrophicus TaxID=2967975 RepID=UPI0023AE951D|nr:zinc-ribbon domain-containing protein [Sedimenticola hydrogenitrophicus]
MALVNCEECNKEVSDKAASCPNCGAPLQVATTKQSLWDSVSQSSGPKEVVIRGTDPAYEGRKLGEGLIMMVMALFLHPVFSFVGFWLICTGLLLSFVHVSGIAVSLDTKDSPIWFFMAMGVSGVLTVLFRKMIPATMKWMFFIAVGVLGLAFVGGIISAIIERST